MPGTDEDVLSQGSILVADVRVYGGEAAIDGWSAQSLWDGGSLFMSLSGSGGTLKATYSNLPGLDAPLAQTRGSSTSYYATDDLGSVEGLFNGSGVQNNYRYDPWGQPQVATGSVTNSLRYAGLPWNGSTGLTYMRARYYDPGLGRFISEDPLGLSAGINPYAYVGDSPTNGTDPSGLCEWVRYVFVDQNGNVVRSQVECVLQTVNVEASGPGGGSSGFMGSAGDRGADTFIPGGGPATSVGGGGGISNAPSPVSAESGPSCTAAQVNYHISVAIDGTLALSMITGTGEVIIGARVVGESAGHALADAATEFGFDDAKSFGEPGEVITLSNSIAFQGAFDHRVSFWRTVKESIPFVATYRAWKAMKAACSN